MTKQEIETKLEEAFDNGFIPKQVTENMKANNHSGRVWLVDQEDERIGVGYRLPEEDGGGSHIHVFSLEEAEKVLKEVK